MKRRLIQVLAICLFLVSLTPQPTFADNGNRYTVQRGDTMLKIAARFGISVVELAAANSVDWDAWVFVGQQIVVPNSLASSSGSALESETSALYATDPRVPDPQPELPVFVQWYPRSVAPDTYARVVQDDVPVYDHPSYAVQGLPPKRRLGAGFIWVSVAGKISYEGRDFFEINADEYVPAEALSIYAPSTFQGIALAGQPELPFAWILKPVQPLLTPGGDVNPEAPVYARYRLVSIFATERLGNQVWYLIGPHQWINQVYVGKVSLSEPPQGVEPGAAWIEVNLFEQTLAAYVGDRMLYATLVSTGLPGWGTPPGLSKVWLKVEKGKMSGGHNQPDYYFLEDVPWTMYFNRDVGLHTAYWHDGYGYKRSHGCVNLAPLDAKWLFEWAPDDVWVWVHTD